MKRVRKFLRFVPIHVLIWCMFALALFALIFIPRMGKSIGTATGNAVGTAIGSMNGITKGIKEGAEAGAAEGLSASDTEVSQTISGSIQAVGKLDVLTAEVKLTDFHKIGDPYSYAVLYLANGEAVFSVDFSDSSVDYNANENKVMIQLPEPEMDCYLDEDSIEKLAEIQKSSQSVDAQDGIEAYSNTVKEMKENAKDKIANYNDLLETAKAAAKSQVTQLAQTVCGTGITVQVEFQ